MLIKGVPVSSTTKVHVKLIILSHLDYPWVDFSSPTQHTEGDTIWSIEPDKGMGFYFT